MFLLILLHGQASLLRTEPLSNFYDVQAHSLVNLRWNVPAAPLGIEGFRIGSRTYEYFGPWPAILRMPVAVVTHQFDGQLTQISMLLAFLVAMVATIRLAWCVREIARGAARVTFGELFAAGGFTFLVGAGSVLLFLSSRLLVFHEAEIWGVALALAAFEWVIRYAQTERGLHLALACGLSTLAVLSRVSVGAGPLIALGIVFLAGFGARTRGVAGLAPDWATWRNALRVVAALLIPFALYVYVNYAKFGSAFSVPFDRQVVTFNDPLHRQVLAANNNSMIGPQFVPTVLAQYVRPDAIRFDSLFPWVAFPPPAHVFGHVSFDRLDVTSSIPGTMPALGVLAIIGLVVVVRRRRDGAGVVCRAASLGRRRAPLARAGAGVRLHHPALPRRRRTAARAHRASRGVRVAAVGREAETCGGGALRVGGAGDPRRALGLVERRVRDPLPARVRVHAHQRRDRGLRRLPVLRARPRPRWGATAPAARDGAAVATVAAARHPLRPRRLRGPLLVERWAAVAGTRADERHRPLHAPCRLPPARPGRRELPWSPWAARVRTSCSRAGRWLVAPRCSSSSPRDRHPCTSPGSRSPRPRVRP